MVRHNNTIPNNHFHKDWQRRIRQNFKQPFAKLKREQTRIRKNRKNLPRPVHRLRPLVHCPTVRYHTKKRFGRGFSLQELKSAKISREYAKSVGISVDRRRRNKSFESVLVNKHRLQTYMSKMIVFAKGCKDTGRVFEPVKKGLNRLEGGRRVVKARVPSDEERGFQAFVTLRVARGKLKKQHRRSKRDKEKTDVFEEKKV